MHAGGRPGGREDNTVRVRVTLGLGLGLGLGLALALALNKLEVGASQIK